MRRFQETNILLPLIGLVMVDETGKNSATENTPDVKWKPESGRLIQWLRPEEQPLWDAFVTTHHRGSVYHLSRWKAILEDTFPHIRGRFLTLRDDRTNEITAGLPIYNVKSWLLGNRNVSVPFASFCDPLVSTVQDLNLLLNEVRNNANKSGAQRISVRSLRTAHECAPFLEVEAIYKHHYLTLDKSCNELFASFAKTSVCQKINRAKRIGVTIEERHDLEALRICYSVLDDTRRRLGLPPMPFSFFESMRCRLAPNHFKMYLAMWRGKPVGSHLVLPFKDLWISEYSGNTDLAPHGVNQLLYWQTIQDAVANGAKWFSFGRTSADNHGLLAYKRRWATTEEDVVHFSNDSDARLTKGVPTQLHTSQFLYRAAKLLLGKAPPPVRRLIGDFCYRHIG